MLIPEDIPFDILPSILAHLSDRRDLYVAALVSRAFNRAATPGLYATLDSRLISTNKSLVATVHHPAATLLRRPVLALYVREVQETGSVHGAPQSHSQSISALSLQALALCRELRSFSWFDDNFLPDAVLLSFLDVLVHLPVRELKIRTFGNLGNAVWDKLHQFSSLEGVSIWCMEGPPRFLQGWSQVLGPTLTHLELGRCSGIPATIFISVLSHLCNLTHLRLKGAPSNTMPIVLTSLPKLLSLDTDYNVSGVYRPSSRPMPHLQTLTVRTSSLDVGGPRELWMWIKQLIPHRSLQTLTLHAFATMGETSVPRRFLLDLAAVHAHTLRAFRAGATQLTLADVRCLCDMFPRLAELTCATASADAKSIGDATAHATSLRALRLNVQWFPQPGCMAGTGRACASGRFTSEDAREMMLRENSSLRLITIGPVLYKGQWVRKSPSRPGAGIRFEVARIHLPNARSDV